MHHHKDVLVLLKVRKKMNDAEKGKIKAKIASKQTKEARILRELRAVRGEIEEEKRKLEGGE